MIYAYDETVPIPTIDLYDSQLMAQSIANAKERYNKAEKRLDDLQKMYGDFYSPSDADMANYKRLVIDPVQNTLDDLYKKGIDPLRSAEGRLAIAQLTRRIPYTDINRLKQSALIQQEYLKNRDKLDAEGKYNEDYEKNYLNYDISNWDTLKNGIWQRYSPSSLDSLKDITNPMFDKLSVRSLTPDEVEQTLGGGQYDPNYEYTGLLYKDLYDAAKNNISGFVDTQQGGYYKYLAEQQLTKEAQAAGIDPKNITQEMVYNRLADMIAGSNIEYMKKPAREENKFALSQQSFRQSAALKKLQHDLDEQAADNALERQKDLLQWKQDHEPSDDSNPRKSNKIEDDPLQRQQDQAVANILGVSTDDLYDNKTGQPLSRPYQMLKSTMLNWSAKNKDKFRQDGKFVYTKADDAFLKRYSHRVGAKSFYDRFGLSTFGNIAGETNDQKGFQPVSVRSFIDDLYSTIDITSMTVGFPQKAISQTTEDRKKYDKKDSYFISTDFVYSPIMKDDGALHNFQEVLVFENKDDDDPTLMLIDLHTSTSPMTDSKGNKISWGGSFRTPSNLPVNPTIDNKNKYFYSQQNVNLSHALHQSSSFVGNPDIIIQ